MLIIMIYLQFNINYFRVDLDKTVKVSDFGLDRDIYVDDYYKAEDKTRPLPVRWMVIESLELGKFSHKSDEVSIYTQVYQTIPSAKRIVGYSLVYVNRRLIKPRIVFCICQILIRGQFGLQNHDPIIPVNYSRTKLCTMQAYPGICLAGK